MQQRFDRQFGVAEAPEPSPPKADVFYVRADHLGTPRTGFRAVHRWQEAGPFAGTDKELFAAYEKAYADPALKDVRVDLRSPDGTEVLCEDCTPLDAIKKMQDWLRGKVMLCG